MTVKFLPAILSISFLLLSTTCTSGDNPIKTQVGDFGDDYVLSLTYNQDGTIKAIAELSDGIIHTGAYYSGGCKPHDFKLYFRVM